MAEDSSLKSFSKAILLQQIRAYNNLYKPTHIYPHAQFWARSTRPSSSGCTGRTGSRARSWPRMSSMRSTRATWTHLRQPRWAVPKQPPFLRPAGRVDPAKPPYPDYVHAITEEPQAFPEARRSRQALVVGGKSFRTLNHGTGIEGEALTLLAALVALGDGEYVCARQDHPALLPAAGCRPGRVGAGGTGDLWRHLRDSIKREFVAFLWSTAAIPLGIAIAWWSGRGPGRSHHRDPPAVPPLAWIPLSILWFGIGDVQNQLSSSSGCFFPSLINTVRA